MTEQRISLHPTAVSQPCTNCGIHGGWSEVGRKGTYTPPPGHTLREDGTIACPKNHPPVVATVIATLETMAEQLICDDDRRDLRDVAAQTKVDWDGMCCPVCQEATCDEGCPLETIRDEENRSHLKPAGWLHTDATPKTEPSTIAPLTPDEQHRELLCAYLRHHGINPDQVPAGADANIDLDRRTLTIEVLAPELGDDRHAWHGTNRTMRARRTVPLLVTFDDFRRNLATPS